MSQKTKADEDRNAFFIYQSHALDELHLAQFHAKELARSDAEREKITEAFYALRVRIAQLEDLLPPVERRGLAEEPVPAHVP